MSTKGGPVFTFSLPGGGGSPLCYAVSYATGCRSPGGDQSRVLRCPFWHKRTTLIWCTYATTATSVILAHSVSLGSIHQYNLPGESLHSLQVSPPQPKQTFLAKSRNTRDFTPIVRLYNEDTKLSRWDVNNIQKDLFGFLDQRVFTFFRWEKWCSSV